MTTNTLQMIGAMLGGNQIPVNYNGIDYMIDTIQNWLFDFDFPFYDETLKDAFCKHWILHFFMSEIAFETVARFKLEVKDTFLTLLPQYNKMFSLYAEDFEIDESVNYTRTYQGTSKGQHNRNLTENEDATFNGNVNRTQSNTMKAGGQDSVSNTNVNQNAYSDTPEGTLNNVDALSYLSDYRRTEDDGSSTTTYGRTDNGTETEGIDTTNRDNRVRTEGENGTTTGEDQHTETVRGNMGVNPLSVDYDRFYRLMKSPMELFFSDCRKRLFLMSWDLW